MKCGKPFGMDFSASRAMTIRRIEGGIFGNLTDIDTSMTPFEAGLGFFVNMDKGDFIGKDSLKEKDKRPCLFGLTCAAETVQWCRNPLLILYVFSLRLYLLYLLFNIYAQ